MSSSFHYGLFKYPYLEIFNRKYIKNYTCLPGGESYYDEGMLLMNIQTYLTLLENFHARNAHE